MAETLISFAADGGHGYGAALIRPRSAAAVLLGDGEPSVLASGTAEVGEGTVRISAGADSLELALSGQSSPIGFEAGDDLTASAQPARVEVSRGAGPAMRGSGVVWNAERGDPDADSLLRTLWALLADGSLLLVMAARPPAAEAHGEERIGTALIAGREEPRSFAEPLLSTEYDADGTHTRATLELWPGEEDAIATRGAGTRTEGARAAAGEAELLASRFAWRLEGVKGIGGYEIVRG